MNGRGRNWCEFVFFQVFFFRNDHASSRSWQVAATKFEVRLQSKKSYHVVHIYAWKITPYRGRGSMQPPRLKCSCDAKELPRCSVSVRTTWMTASLTSATLDPASMSTLLYTGLNPAFLWSGLPRTGMHEYNEESLAASVVLTPVKIQGQCGSCWSGHCARQHCVFEQTPVL